MVYTHQDAPLRTTARFKLVQRRPASDLKHGRSTVSCKRTTSAPCSRPARLLRSLNTRVKTTPFLEELHRKLCHKSRPPHEVLRRRTRLETAPGLSGIPLVAVASRLQQQAPGPQCSRTTRMVRVLWTDQGPVPLKDLRVAATPSTSPSPLPKSRSTRRASLPALSRPTSRCPPLLTTLVSSMAMRRASWQESAADNVVVPAVGCRLEVRLADSLAAAAGPPPVAAAPAAWP